VATADQQNNKTETEIEIETERRMSESIADLTECAMSLSVIQRTTVVRPDGRPESVADHTVHLGLLACALAQHCNTRYRAGLDCGEIAQLALVHDLPETRTGDTDTLRVLTPLEKDAKHKNEAEATRELRKHFYAKFPWVSDLLSSYQYKIDPEAKFVWAVDKIAVKFVHLANGPGHIAMPSTDMRVRFHSQRKEILAELADSRIKQPVAEFLLAVHREVCNQVVHMKVIEEREEKEAK
jgi:5'-deoxynucleotidase YfbR-like HD superfamily hydrolase